MDNFRQNPDQLQPPEGSMKQHDLSGGGNWKTVRKETMKKYDLNNDGKFDGHEVENIIDEYMSTLYKHQALSTENKSQKKSIAFGAVMIILLSLSNLGTAFLAINLAKETRVVDGKIVNNDGTDSGVKIESAVKSFSAQGIPVQKSRPRVLSEGDEAEWETFACFTSEEVEGMVEAVAESGMANTVVRDKRNVIQRIVPLSGRTNRGYDSNGSGRALQNSLGPMVIKFPEVGVAFVENDPNCVGMSNGRCLQSGGFGGMVTMFGRFKIQPAPAVSPTIEP